MKTILTPLCDRFDRIVFVDVCPRSAGILRFVFGLLITWQLSFFALTFDDWLANDGWLNSKCNNLSLTSQMSLLNGVSDSSVLRIFLAAVIVSSVMMTIGLFSRASTIATCVGLTSLQARLSPVLCGGDIVAQIVTFYLCFARTGEFLAVDRYLFKRTRALTIPGWPIQLLKFHICLIYVASFMHKICDQCWIDGTVLYYALHYADNRNFPLPDFFREPPVTSILSYCTLAVEGAFGLFPFLSPAGRRNLLLLAVGMHLGIAYFMFIPNFAPVMISSYVAFLDYSWSPSRTTEIFPVSTE